MCPQETSLRIQELVVSIMSQFRELIVIQTRTVLLQLGSQDGNFGRCSLFFITQNFLHQITSICIVYLLDKCVNTYTHTHTHIHTNTCWCLKYRENGISWLLFANLMTTLFITLRLQAWILTTLGERWPRDKCLPVSCAKSKEVIQCYLEVLKSWVIASAKSKQSIVSESL